MAQFPNGRQVRLGLDIDGTITTDPPRFAALAKRVVESAGAVYIVTSRSQLAYQESIEEIRGYGLPFVSLHCLPSIDAMQKRCPHGELDWYLRYLWGKVEVAHQLRLTHFSDDDLRVASLFEIYASNIRFRTPVQIDDLITSED
jgi:hypothetical protein